MKNLINKTFNKIFGIIRSEYLYRTDKTSIKAYWHNTLPNFGDILNPIFINQLTNKKVIWIKPGNYKHTNYLIMGSILDTSNKHSIVWGAGFIGENTTCYQKPAKIFAVRGPLTRASLLKAGIDCPEVYGDPALLLPFLYKPKIKKLYKLGIIPHHVDYKSKWLKNINDSDVKIIDIQNPNPLEFIDDLLSCEKIASSSLHGIIVADAYNIPSLWLEFSNNVVGNGFKFQDYFLSVNRQNMSPIIIDKSISIDDILSNFENYHIDIDLKKLIDACPFDISNNIKDKI